MTVKYKTVITKAGAEKLAAATVPNGKKVNFTAMAVGDGGGVLPTPNANQTKLINEVWRHALNKISQDKKNKNYVVAELLIPPEVGGFWMREMGLYDDAGTLIAVGNMAESYKPTLAEGSGRAQTLRMVIMVSDIASVELTIDTSTVMATQDYVDEKLTEHEQSRRHPDATLAAKGFTQLSSAIDSASEVLAATPKAVKAAYDLANGKYTAADATTARKGIVQLSSATDSVSEVLAATPKAVKTVNDTVNDVKKNLGTAAAKDVQTSKDDVTAGRVLVNGGALALRTVLAGAGRAVTDFNDLPENAVSFGYDNATNSSGFTGSVLDFSGSSGRYRVQLAAQYNGNGNRIAFRTRNGDAVGVWNTWGEIYHTRNKPSPADINAVSKSGDTMSGVLKVGAEVQSTSANAFRIAYSDYGTFWRNDGSNLYLMLTNKGDAYGGYNALRPLRVSLETGALQSETPFTVGNTIFASKEITAGYSNSFAWAEQYKTKAPFYNTYSTTGASEYHPAFKQQASITGINSWVFSMGSLVADTALSWHLHMKGSGGQDVNYKWDTSGNFSAPGQIIPGSFANFDGRFYTKTLADTRFLIRDSASYAGFANGDASRPYMRHEASNTVVTLLKVGDSYTKADSDGRYYTKAQSDVGYMAKTSAYTKAESEARYQSKGSYITGIRFGASAEYQERGNTERMTGGMMTSFADRGSSNYWIRLRPLQYQINSGAWVTAAYA